MPTSFFAGKLIIPYLPARAMASFSCFRILRRLLLPSAILTQRLSFYPNNPNYMECGNRLMGHESNPVSSFLKSIHCFSMPPVKSPVHKELTDIVPIKSVQRMLKFALEFGKVGLFSRSFTIRKASYLRSIYCFNSRQLATKSENIGTEPIPFISDQPVTRSDAYAAIELALDAVVKVFTVTSSPNYFLPWQNKPQREITGSGLVISGRRILTNAHVVADQTFVLVRKHGSPTKYRAEVQAIGHECDLALLTVNNEEFWEGMNFLEFGNIPYLQEAVAVVGYPQGGDNISVTRGVVSRVELSQYTHGAANLMAIQIDAAINPGNSGGPAIMDEKVVGVAFQNLAGAENIGYIIPVPVIEHFMADINERGKYIGFCTLGVSCQPTENMQLRDHLKMPPGLTGVLVNKINPLCDSHRMLKKDDVIIAFDSVPIANDGTVHFRNRERITFDHLVSMKKAGGTGAVRVLRDGVQHEFHIKLGPVLMDDINTGYERLSEFQVKKVNGMEVDNLKHLRHSIEGCTEKSLRFDLDDERVVVLNYEDAKDATSRILKRHRIPFAMSFDLMEDAERERLECKERADDTPIEKAVAVSRL